MLDDLPAGVHRRYRRDRDLFRSMIESAVVAVEILIILAALVLIPVAILMDWM